MIGSNMASTINTPPNCSHKDYLKMDIGTNFKFNTVTEAKVQNIIEQLNSRSSSGYDGLSTSLLKKIKLVISRPLTTIINQSLNTGIFPDKLKLAKIIPVHKKGSKHSTENYRPISLLPSISTIFEKIVFEQLYSYFVKHNYLCNNQYGFRKQHSTEYAVLEIVDRIAYALEKGNMPLALFLDLSFDTLDHSILLSKLEFYGINGLPLKWFETYLKNRSYFVEMNYVKSKTAEINIGVPQGSILGPLLFIIYINDLKNCTGFF